MRIDIATLFPEMCEAVLGESIIGRARRRGKIEMYCHNIRDYTFSQAGGYERWMSMLNYQYNNEPEAMRDVMMIYGGLRKPILVLFLTDGRLQSDWEIEEILIKTSRFRVFWQFIGLYGEEYGVLNHLDEIDGRHTQNAAFFKMEDLEDFMDSGFYRTIFANAAAWLEELGRRRML